ncbi:hypothetical protein BASA62_004077 [Batrachochytrium salamandrivorans]|nr:hypothetical protein BASA62_004077 [Batrachochytrium salamandrivorans]
MPKNKGKGGKNRKRGKNENESDKRELVFKEDGQERFGLVWGDVLLLGLRDYQDSKADVILKYTPDEARLLKSYGELPDNVRINETEMTGEVGEEGFDVEFDIDEI